MKKIDVKDGQKVKKDDLLFINADGEEVTAKRAGTVKVEKEKITVAVKEKNSKIYQVPAEFHILGKEETMRYVVDEIQSIYGSQGQKLDNRHVELIVKQMFSRLLILDPGDTE